ncbi:hypothetical protein F441_21732 [Phytophthora nicotianae CJ01A1]|uniref:Uncharacterized protein n=2 Tax=Phytophthora nicotianae TaxID=4792 RepID=V9DWT8_PHYNI|nr:hypothetical protein F443_21850 [Phytophthora nicotianae P1569]ETP00945.1 hypothetical protein F441_21732 [Phytophthora nicotianae CJ01A1]
MVKNLHPTIASVSNHDFVRSLRTKVALWSQGKCWAKCKTSWKIEFTRCHAHTTKITHKFTGNQIEDLNAVVALIADEKKSVFPNCNSLWRIEEPFQMTKSFSNTATE